MNVDTPLDICAEGQKWAVILFFLWAEDAPGGKMHRRLSVQYGNSVILQHVACELIDRLKNGRTSIQHEEGAGCPSTSITDAEME